MTANAAWLEGACHCGAVRFWFRPANDFYTLCNCSYCIRKAAKHYRVKGQAFRYAATDAHLAVYQFATRRAVHLFCARCGSHTHCRPRSAPQEVNVNLNCLIDELHVWLSSLEERRYDGRSL
ncbi:hypothetical protein PS3A_11450 [Pseudomonas sp. 3A(2025)]